MTLAAFFCYTGHHKQNGPALAGTAVGSQTKHAYALHLTAYCSVMVQGHWPPVTYPVLRIC